MADLESIRAAKGDPAVFARVLVGQELWPHQRAVLASPARYRLVTAGRQVGKSRTLAVAGLHQAYAVPRSTTLVVSAGDTAAKRVMGDVASLAQASPLLAGSVVDETSQVVTLSSGSTVRSVPSSMAQVRGWSTDLLIVDEAAFVSSEIWRSAEPAIVARPGSRVLASSSPWGAVDHWFQTLWRRGVDSPDAMYESFHWPSTVSPLVDQALVDHWRESWPELEFRREVLAEWTDDAGAYFTEAELSAAVGEWEMVPPAAGAQLGLVVGGIDWGYSTDANTLAVIAALPELDERGRVRYWVPWVQEEFRKPYADWIDDLAEMTATPRFPAGFTFGTLVAEGNGVGAMPSAVLQSRLSELGVGQVVDVVMTDLRLKESAFGWLKLLLQQGRLELPNYPPLLKQLRSLSFERLPAGGVRISVPERAGHDDLAMALCLAASAVMGSDLPAPVSVLVEDEDLFPELRDYQISPF
jgi:RNase P/RNase MRP subunit p29